MDFSGTLSSSRTTAKSDVTFHPNSTQIAKRCKQANESASKKLSLDMEKLSIEQQRVYQRVEKEQELLCQELSTEEKSESRRTPSETLENRFSKRAQRSKTMDLRETYSKRDTITFDISSNIRRTTSLRVKETGNSSISSPSAFLSSSSSGLSEQQLLQQITKQTKEIVLPDVHRMPREDVQPPDWQVALAAKRRRRISQLRMFRELGHWGEDDCEKATAMLAGCPFSPILSSSSALSHSGESVKGTEESATQCREFTLH